jgi:cobalt-zinc-cadmium efflux system outer membrane protein
MLSLVAGGGALTLLALTPGCQKVDARPDFQRAGAIVEATTGHALGYRPEDERLVADRVDELLRDGLTPAEAVEVGLLNNPRLQAAFMDVGIARADVVQAGMLSNPSLGISARFPSGGGLANIEADLAQNVADLWRIKPRTLAAERNLDATVLDLAREAANLSAEIETAYYEAVGRAQIEAIAQQNLATARELLQMATLQREHGAATEIDVNLSRSVVFESELESQSARLAAAEARRTLAELLGLTTDADELVLSAALPEPPTATLSAPDLIAIARESRLDLRAAWQRVDAAEAELVRERGSLFGDVTVGLSMERGERRSGEPSEHTDLIIGPSLEFELPIFDQNQARVARATFTLQRAIKTLEAIERPIVHEIRGAVDRSDTAWRLVRLYREQSLPLAESNVALSREAYRAGRTSLLGVMEAQRFLLTTRRRYVEAWMGAAETMPALHRAVARPQATATQPDATDTTENGGPSAGNEVQP